ncbi:TonB-dependent receptor [Pontibacter roseus]|uniref:TonB-dependent receptor n=1 Tax=Pontibacter roseus TaxID=336989 RepID=UPI000367ECB3|nr:TonB-dependent receptor [Pontibacter roseus]
MKQLYRLLLFSIACMLVMQEAAGQSTTRQTISGSFSGLSFTQFVTQVEAQTDYRFYYNPTVLDSLTVDLQAQQQPLPVVLDRIFQGTAYQYAIDAQERVFVVKNADLQATLPEGFFARGDEEASDEKVPDFMAGAAGKKLIGSSDSKLYEIGIRTNNLKPGNATIAGTVVNAKTGEPVIGAVVLIENPLTAVSTNAFGFYSLTLPRGRHELKIKSVGMQEAKRQIILYSDGKFNVELREDVVSLKEVLVEADRDKNVSGLMMGVEKLDIKTMKQVPTAFGEADVLKVVLTLPGVKSVGESSTGLNVRGGATDQNLILFNDAPVYNPSHLFGFFSAFNPDVLKGVELYKNSIPAKHGGRLASVLEVTSRDGNKKKFAGSGGIGLVSTRLTLEGPIIKDKTSFLVGGRTTYSDWLLKKLPNDKYKNSKASFFDVNANISHEINEKNSLYASGYMSGDKFKLGSDTLYTYQNQSASLRWNRVFTNSLYGVFSAGYSSYKYNVASERVPVNGFDLAYDLNQSNVKADFTYYPNPKHVVDFGASSILYRMKPGSYLPKGAESLVKPDVLEPEQGAESAIYISDQYEISPRFSVSVGLRYSFYTYLGAKNVRQYAPGASRSEFSVVDTVSYGSGEAIKTYHGPEYRFSARYNLNENTSIKFGYNRMRQYIHTLTNTTTVSPTDVWKLSDSYIRPQVGDQYSIGLFRNLRANTIEVSLETYYKTMRDFLDFKSGARLIMNHHIETDIINSRGQAYGVEAMVRKSSGKLNGWVSYTYSRSLVKSNDANSPEVVNKGRYYPSNFDKPHDATLVGNYRFSRRFSTSVNVTYSTGRPITLPMGNYEIGGARRVYYSDRNQFRIPDYFRTDVALNIEGNHKIKKLAHSSWTVSVYNLTGRKNPYSVYFITENGKIKGYKMSVFGQPIPTVTYNFKF